MKGCTTLYVDAIDISWFVKSQKTIVCSKKSMMKSMWLQPSSIIKITFHTIYIVFVLSTVYRLYHYSCKVYTVYINITFNSATKYKGCWITNNTWQRLKFLYAYNDSMRLNTIVRYIFRSLVVIESLFFQFLHLLFVFFTKFYFCKDCLININDKNVNCCMYV